MQNLFPYWGPNKCKASNVNLIGVIDCSYKEADDAQFSEWKLLHKNSSFDVKYVVGLGNISPVLQKKSTQNFKANWGANANVPEQFFSC